MRNIFLILLILFNVNLFSQDEKIIESIQFLKNGELVKAQNLIDDLLYKVENKSNPFAWYSKGVIYHVISESEDLRVKKDNINYLEETFISYKNAMQYDKTKQYQSDLTKRLNILANQFSNKGVKYFNENKFSDALSNFEYSIEISKMPMFNRIDTNTIYNAALSAYFAKNYDQSLKHFLKLIDVKYNNPEIYFNISEVYKIKNEVESSLNYLKKGIEIYPTNTKLFDQLINSLIDINQKDDAKNYLEEKVKSSTSNFNYYLLLSDLLDTKEEFDRKELLINEAIKYGSNNYKPYYKLGILYFNRAIEQNELVNSLTDELEYKAQKRKVDEYFQNSLFQIEKSYKLKSDEKNTLLKLKFLYKRFNQEEKLQIVLKQLGEK